MAKKLTLETTAPFQGLPELVAYDEDLFAEQGLEIEWVERGQTAPKQTNTSVTTTEGLSPFLSHASSFESGQAGMYNACEWGNYRRVQDSDVGGRQLGRRGIIAYGAIVVAPSSPVYTPQQLANKLNRSALLRGDSLPGTADVGRVSTPGPDKDMPVSLRVGRAVSLDDEW